MKTLTPTQAKRYAKTLRRAAKELSKERDFCCVSIYYATWDDHSDIISVFSFIMGNPKNRDTGWFGTTYKESNQERRIIALLLTAEWLESEYKL